MKRRISMFALAVFLMTSVLFGCGKNGAETDANKLSVVTTIFPEYDWVREITKGNDDMEITMLLDKGVDLHSYSPTTDDLIKVSTCDMFIYVGGESDEWVEDALEGAKNPDMVVINLLDVLGDSVKEEELVEGMEGEMEEEEGEEEEEVEYDEHVWLSLKNAKTICEYIAEELSEMDTTHKELYANNVNAYVRQLDELDKEYETVAQAATTKTILFGDRFPFRYLADDYGLDYYAAFVGCSAESEASFETITFLANKVDELGLHTIFQIESADGKIAETIRDNTQEKNQEIVTLDSLQSVTKDGVEKGITYYDVMTENLAVLQKALAN